MAWAVSHRLPLVVASCLTLVGGSHLHAQGVGLPESIRAVLRHYSDLDPLAVTWSETTKAAPLGREKIAADVLRRITNNDNVFLLAFRDGRIYMRREPVAGRSDKSATNEFAFDRSILYSGDPAKEPQPRNPNNNPTLIKWMPAKDQPEAGYFSNGYFRATGVRLPTRVRELVLSWHPQSELLALLAHGGRVEAASPAELDDDRLMRIQVTAQDLSNQYPSADTAQLEKKLRIMQTAGAVSGEEVRERLAIARKSQGALAPQHQFDFYFDPEQGYALRRLDTLDEAGRLLTRSDCTEHEQLTGRNIWLPRRCRVEHYTFVGLEDQVFKSPLFVEEFSVSGFDLQPWPYDRFELKYTKPGTNVNDGTFPGVEGSVIYEIPASPEQLDEVIETARAKYQSQANARKLTPSVGVMLLVLNGVLLVGLVVYFVLRRRRARSA